MTFDLGSQERLRSFDPYPSRSRAKTIFRLAAFFTAALFAAFLVASSSGYKFKALLPSLLGETHDFAPLYARYGVTPIPASDVDSDMYARLRKLEAEPCDLANMQKIGKALDGADDIRLAANFYLGFSHACNNNEHAERAAARLYYKLNDFRLALKYFADLVARFPQNDQDWYHKGQSEAKLGQSETALESYATMISLIPSKERLGDWVFYEMAGIYASEGRFCEAMTPIDTYVSLDPHARDTSKTRQVLASYAQRGTCRRASGSASFPVYDNNVVNVRATINGVVGTFAIDTGASFVSLTPAFAEKAKVATSGAIHTSTANGDIEVKLSKASTITLGGLKATDVPLVVVTKPIGRIDGLLGRSFLSRYEMKLTPRRLTLTSKAS